MLAAREDELLHPAAAQRFGTLLTESPADRIDKIALAAAVRADHHGDPLVEFQLGSIGKRFETE